MPWHRRSGAIACASLRIDLPAAATMNHDSDYGGGSGAQSRCVPDVGTAEALWSDRDYAWIDAPGDILRGGWTYYVAPLDPAAGAPRVISDCHFRRTATEYDRKTGIKWLSCTEK